ncbi:MAG TPA: hypothetical protein VEI97_04465, partial [bacterium]|nr:hypothetical protein [bacterium]
MGKLDGVTGAWIWVTQGTDPGAGSGYGITVDNAGSVFVTGQFEGTVLAFPGHPPVPGSGNLDVFVAQLNAATGACVSAVAGGGAAGDIGRSIAFLPAVPGTPPGGMVYVTGEYASNPATFGGTVLGNASVPGITDLFVSNLAVTGAGLTWL